jgi:hypothetical protein
MIWGPDESNIQRFGGLIQQISCAVRGLANAENSWAQRLAMAWGVAADGSEYRKWPLKSTAITCLGAGDRWGELRNGDRDETHQKGDEAGNVDSNSKHVSTFLSGAKPEDSNAIELRAQ